MADQPTGPHTVVIEIMLVRRSKTYEIQGVNALGIGAKLLFRPKQSVTSPKVELTLGSRHLLVPRGILSRAGVSWGINALARAVVREIHVWLEIIHRRARVH